MERRRWNSGDATASSWEPSDRPSAIYDGTKVELIQRRFVKWMADSPSAATRDWFEYEIELPDRTRKIVNEGALDT